MAALAAIVNSPGAMPRTILIVQHDEPARRQVARCLVEAGYDVVEARTFIEARNILEQRPPDLLITDIRLDGYNGLQLLATRDERIPSLVFTNLPDPVLEADAHALGAEYLLKPVSRDTLLERVQGLFDGERPRVASFTTRRRGVRTYLTASVAAQAGECAARVVDISNTGVRLELPDVAGASLPRTFRLTVPPSETVFEMKAVWKRRNEDGRWVYGATVQGYQEYVWRAVVDAKTLAVKLMESAGRTPARVTGGTTH